TWTSSSTTWAPDCEASGCWYTRSPEGVAATAPRPLGFSTDSSNRASPSGPTHPFSTGTDTVPPDATCGSGQVARHPSTPQNSGAALPGPATWRVTVAGSDERPSALVPSVTRYWNVAEPWAAASTRTASRCPSPVIDTVPNSGS